MKPLDTLVLLGYTLFWMPVEVVWEVSGFIIKTTLKYTK